MSHSVEVIIIIIYGLYYSKSLSSPRTVFLKQYVVPHKTCVPYTSPPPVRRSTTQRPCRMINQSGDQRTATLRVLRFIWVRSTAASTPLLSHYPLPYCNNNILYCYPITKRTPPTTIIIFYNTLYTTRQSHCYTPSLLLFQTNGELQMLFRVF